MARRNLVEQMTKFLLLRKVEIMESQYWELLGTYMLLEILLKYGVLPICGVVLIYFSLKYKPLGIGIIVISALIFLSIQYQKNETKEQYIRDNDQGQTSVPLGEGRLSPVLIRLKNPSFSGMYQINTPNGFGSSAPSRFN